MPHATPQNLRAQLIEFLQAQLGVEDALTADTPLVTNGLIDSVGLMRLAAFVEDASGVTIPDQDINAGHFDTIRQIEAYLESRIGA